MDVLYQSILTRTSAENKIKLAGIYIQDSRLDLINKVRIPSNHKGPARVDRSEFLVAWSLPLLDVLVMLLPPQVPSLLCPCPTYEGP